MTTADTMTTDQIDMSDCRGNLAATVGAAELAVTERRNLLIVATPGIGATMVARRIPTIMPPLTPHQQRWLRAEYEAAGLVEPSTAPLARRRYYNAAEGHGFRAPHHSVSDVALVGCAARAGEIALARFGVLYLDELPEFRVATVRALAFALRDMAGAPLVVASTTPCPCGWRGSRVRECRCSSGAVDRHQRRYRQFADMLDVSVTVEQLEPLTLQQLRGYRARPEGESSAQIRARVQAARPQ